MILTFFIGMYGEAFNMAPGNNFPNIGVILSVTVMGGFIMFRLQKYKPPSNDSMNDSNKETSEQ